jgi:hypothetical protein
MIVGAFLVLIAMILWFADRRDPTSFEIEASFFRWFRLAVRLRGRGGSRRRG